MKRNYQFLLLFFISFFYQCAVAATTCDKSFELSTQGNQIVDQCGNKFKLKSVNWYGAHEPEEVVGGLDKQPLKKIVSLIKEGGFNSVRLTFSNHMLHDARMVDSRKIAANPEFNDKTPLQLFDEVIKALTDAGIVVILNNHTTLSEWCCGFDFNGLWHHPDYQSSDEWLNDWILLAKRYRDNPYVAGFDLRNEVRTARYHTTIIPVFPNWGRGDENDWKLAATQAGNAIHQINSHALIIVEGINWYGVPLINGYRPMLEPIKNNPIVLDQANKLVYEEHVYSFTGPRHTGDDRYSRGQMRYRDMDEATLRSTLDEEFGYVVEPNQPYTTPVWMGEIGAGYNAAQDEQIWFQRLTNYLLDKDLGWGIWALNPERADGTEDAYGLLKPDWSDYRSDWRAEFIQRLIQSN